jgi:hypothetical protein
MLRKFVITALCISVLAVAALADEPVGCFAEVARKAAPAWPAPTPEQVKEAEKLLAEYLKPVEPVEPSDTDRAAIARLIAALGADDFTAREDASAAIVKHGPAALGQLRAALASRDPEVVTRAEGAIEQIGQEARAKSDAGLKAIPGAAVQVCGTRQQQLATKITEAYQKTQRARAAGRTAEADAAEREHAALLVQSALLQGLLGEIYSGRFASGRR